MEQNYKKYIRRCIDLALNGKGKTKTNPMVGCVILHNNIVIGEGYHERYGGPHAEVNAIASVKNQDLLKESTLFVSLEPCSHMGKTPPCSDLIIEMQIPRVVIGSRDPNSLVAGKGIDRLKNAGVEVVEGVLTNECMAINKRFFTYHSKKRPYIILKWAQSLDGFIDIKRNPNTPIGPFWISNPLSLKLVHKWRSEENAILVGTNTVVYDNPSLTTREWPGESPVRVVLDRTGRLSSDKKVFSPEAKTLVFTEKIKKNNYNTFYIETDFKSHSLEQILTHLWDEQIQSVIVEGGREIFDSFLAQDLWDEARVFIGQKTFQDGTLAPVIKGSVVSEYSIFKDRLLVYYNKK